MNKWILTTLMLTLGMAASAEQQFLELKEGDTIPLHIQVDGEFLSSEGDIFVEVKKSCYIKCDENEILFSADLTEWKDFENSFSGKIESSLNNEGAVLHFELNEKKN